mmetsp:Transcript_54356/g.140400  ORF Transcript_54356/g.140400 Transcript_54356/m.140400 type:complete len:83 (+) Transcript_54356:284-532(+)
MQAAQCKRHGRLVNDDVTAIAIVQCAVRRVDKALALVSTAGAESRLHASGCYNMSKQTTEDVARVCHGEHYSRGLEKHRLSI